MSAETPTPRCGECKSDKTSTFGVLYVCLKCGASRLRDGEDIWSVVDRAVANIPPWVFRPAASPGGQERATPTPEQIGAVKGHLIVCADCTAGDYCTEGVRLGVEAMEARWHSAVAAEPGDGDAPQPGDLPHAPSCRALSHPGESCDCHVSDPLCKCGKRYVCEWSEEYWQLDQAVLDAEQAPRTAQQIAMLRKIRDGWDALAADARLGSALREAVAKTTRDTDLTFAIARDGALDIWPDTDATRKLSALLRSSPARDATGDEQHD